MNKKDAVLPWQQTGDLCGKGEEADDTAWVWFADPTAPAITAAKSPPLVQVGRRCHINPETGR